MSDDFNLDAVCGSTGNVERLGVRPVPPRIVEPPVVLEEAVIARVVQNIVAESHQNLLTVIPQAVKAATDDAIKQVMLVLPQGARQLANAAVQTAMTETYDRTVGTLNVIAKCLAIRFILLLAVAGGFALALMVLLNPSIIGASILGGYVVSTIWPLVWLFSRAPGSGTTSDIAG